MLSEALAYPRQSDNWLKAVGIGGVLLIFSFLVIPAFIVYGYMLRVMRAGASGSRQLPEWGDWGTLLVDGLKMFAISLAYLIVPILVGTILAGATKGAISGLFALLGFVLYLLAYLFLPAAIVNFATTGDFGQAFDFGTIRSIAFTSDYIVAVIVALVVGAIGGGIAGLLTFILVGFFVLFYLEIALAYYLAGAVAKAAGARQPTAGAGAPAR